MFVFVSFLFWSFNGFGMDFAYVCMVLHGFWLFFEWVVVWLLGLCSSFPDSFCLALPCFSILNLSRTYSTEVKRPGPGLSAQSVDLPPEEAFPGIDDDSRPVANRFQG